MKNILLYVSRLLVGSLLIVSGVIKANDTLGFSYKLVDYFTDGVLGMEFLQPYTLIMAGVICAIEIVLGAALIFGVKPKLTTTLNLLMMLFFTFLTFYSAYYNKVTDCGCFGDALKLKPWETFGKDVVLSFFSIILFLNHKKIFPNSKQEDLKFIIPSILLIILFSVGVIGWWFPVIFAVLIYGLMLVAKRYDKNPWRLLSISVIATCVFIFYTLSHLPIEDFRPFAIEKNISEGMVPDPDALPEITEYTWTFDVNGETVTKVTNGSYPEVKGGTNTNVTTKIIREAEEPPVHDFTIENDTQDDTQLMLSKDNVLTIVAYDFDKSSDAGFKAVKIITDNARTKGYTVIGLTAEDNASRLAKSAEYGLGFQWYFCDAIALKTMVRANPGIIEMDKATIKQKLHWRDIDKLEL